MPFVRGHRSVFPRTPRNTGVYTRHPTFVTATSGLHAVRQAVEKKLRVYTSSEAKGLKEYVSHFPNLFSLLMMTGAHYLNQEDFFNNLILFNLIIIFGNENLG